MLCRWLVISAVWTGFTYTIGADSSKGEACEWLVCNIRPQDESFACDNNSLIFVESVTNFRGTPNEAAYQNIRQMCMGVRSCDPSRLCRRRTDPLRVRYVCVSASSISNECGWHVETIWRREGHIQTPYYPAAFRSQSCLWRITAPEDRFVHLSIHDVSSEHSSGTCYSSLNITYQACETGDVVSVLSCESTAKNELIACGSVSVELIATRPGSDVRFWLSYTVTSSPEAAVRPPLLQFAGPCTQGRRTSSRALSSEVLPLPFLRPLYPTATAAMASSTTTPDWYTSALNTAIASTEAPSTEREKISITVVIIVVSTIGAVLLVAIILTVIFLKRPRIERVEHVYAVPTPCDTSPGSPPNSASPLKHERPILRDCYCEVADSIASRVQATPASPGYAEVEDVCKGDNCRWDPQKFTFGPSIRPLPPSQLPFSSPNISTFSRTHPNGKTFGGLPTHTRTFSDPAPPGLLSKPSGPFITRSTIGRSFRDPKISDYENIIIDSEQKSPRFADQNYLLYSRLSRATPSAKKVPHGVECVDVKVPNSSSEGLYATSSVVNSSNGPVKQLGPILSDTRSRTGNGSEPTPPIYINVPGNSPGGRLHLPGIKTTDNQRQKSKGGNHVTENPRDK
ncbi:uncharacterized protein [Haliotis cracherodii]|uniref:uncharacterized protein n=1 Tax=Haliotis cracherodii TaxID=6455 RepID=UPI0039E9A283